MLFGSKNQAHVAITDLLSMMLAKNLNRENYVNIVQQSVWRKLYVNTEYIM